MGGREIVTRYGELADTVARMLELARAGQWALLPLLDARCGELFRELREAQPDRVSPPQQAELAALARRIHRDRDALNEAIRPQFVQLVRRMGQVAARG